MIPFLLFPHNFYLLPQYRRYNLLLVYMHIYVFCLMSMQIYSNFSFGARTVVSHLKIKVKVVI